MFTKSNILKEINDLPADKLEEVYEFVHSLGIRKKQKKAQRKKILSFAGAFSDMNKKDFDDVSIQIRNTRAQIFDRNIEI